MASQAPWRNGVKIHKRIKVANLSKVVKRPCRSIFRTCKRFLRKLFRRKIHHQSLGKFMACVIQVDNTKLGWYKAVSKVTRNCVDYCSLQMDENGVVEVSGIGDPDELLKKLSRTTRARLVWIQGGKCSRKLFIPQAKPKFKSNSSLGRVRPEYYPANSGYGYPYQRDPYMGGGGYQYPYQPPSYPYMDHPYQPPPYPGRGYPYPHQQQRAFMPPYGCY